MPDPYCSIAQIPPFPCFPSLHAFTHSTARPPSPSHGKHVPKIQAEVKCTALAVETRPSQDSFRCPLPSPSPAPAALPPRLRHGLVNFIFVKGKRACRSARGWSTRGCSGCRWQGILCHFVGFIYTQPVEVCAQSPAPREPIQLVFGEKSGT